MSWTRTEPPSADELERLFTPAAWQAGEDYVGLERVPTRLVGGGILAGAVHGQRADYWVRLGPDGVACSACRGPCRHAAALAVAFVRAPGTFVDVRDLVNRYLRHGTPDVLIEGLLAGDVLESLETFTEGVFIPPFDEARDLARLGLATGDDLYAAIRRLVRQRRWALLADALAAPITLDPGSVVRIYVDEPSPPDSPLLAWLTVHAAEADLDAVLDYIIGRVYLDRQHSTEVLVRSARLLAAMPGGPPVLGGILEAVQAGEDVLKVAAQLLSAAGRPRQAIALVDRALLTAKGESRRRVLGLGVAIAAGQGSPREAVWRLEALRCGDASQLTVVRRRFPELFEAEVESLIAGDGAIDDANLRALTALAARRIEEAVAIARTAALPAKTLSRITREALRSHVGVGGVRLTHLGHGDFARLSALLLKAGHEPPARRMPARKD